MLNLQWIINHIRDFSNKFWNIVASRDALNVKNQEEHLRVDSILGNHTFFLKKKIKKIFAWLLEPVAKNKNCSLEKSKYLIMNLFVCSLKGTDVGKTESPWLKSEITRRIHHLSKWHPAAKRSHTLRGLLRRKQVGTFPGHDCGGVRHGLVTPVA